ncbi:MAG: hypothetical protein ACKOPO_14050 [Novosphingobium sp.]
MTKIAPTASPLALAAILAAGAIPSTVSAQEAPAVPAAPAPVIVLPPVDAPAPAPAPASPPVQQSAPSALIVVPDVSEPAASASAAPASRTAAVRTSPRSAVQTAPTPRTAAGGASEAGSPSPAPPEPVSEAEAAPMAAPLPADPPPPAPLAEPPADDDGSLTPFALGGLLLGGGMAAAAMAGRRRRRDAPFTPDLSRRPVTDPAAQAAGLLAAPLADGGNADAVQTVRTPAARSVRLPGGPVPTGAERCALIARMVAAPPDAANPFRSRKSRRKRARIMLAAHDHRQRQAATEPFDFRTYRPFSQQEAARTEPLAPYRQKETVN